MHRLSILLAILVAVPAAASAVPQVSLEARQLEWSDAATVPGLVALRALDGPAPTFTLQASTIDAEWVEADAYVVLPGASYTSLFPQTRPESLTNALLRSGESRAGHLLYVLPIDGVSVKLPCGGRAEGGPAEVQAPSMVDAARQPITVDTTNSVALSPCGVVQIVGDFLVVVWETDLEVVKDGQRTTVTTGRYDSNGATSSARQGYLTVHDGNLTIAGDALLMAPTLTLAGQRQLVAADARGAIAGLGAVSASTLRLAGDLDATVTQRGGALSLVAHGAHSVQLDGRAVALTHSPSSWPWLVGVAALVAVAVVAARALRRHRLNARLSETLDLILEAKEGRKRAELYVLALEYALALGNREEAQDLLRAAYVQDPETLKAAAKRPTLRRFADDGYS